MKLWQLILSEIRHRRTSFWLGALAVLIAILGGTLAIQRLRDFDQETQQLAESFRSETEARLKKLEDEIRKSMKGLGFNIHIYPEGQDMSEVYSQGYASKTMPEDYVTKLAESKIATINHLLPSLIRKLKWPEQSRTIVLIGIRGEVPFLHRDPKAPLIDPVDPGTLTIGYELAQSLKLAPGDTTTLLGKEFKIGKTHDERGSADDITIWMHLKEMQDLLTLPGQINEIRALECNCASIDRLGEIRAEIGAILPDTHIIEIESRALARAEARTDAKRTSQEQLAQFQEERQAGRASRERLLAWLLPALLVVSMAWIAYLALTNVRERLSEIATLRTVGLGTTKLLGLFLSRAAIQGVIGGAAALLIAWQAGKIASTSGAWHFSLPESLIVLLGAPLLAIAAAWLPCLHAASRDPAEILYRD